MRTRGNPTMAEKLTDKAIKSLPIPSSGNRITYDSGVRGFGVRTTSAGARSFVLNYRAGGRERRITIGSFPDWSVTIARDRAAALKRQVDDGADPMAERHADRAAPTMNDLADRFEAEHLSKRRATTARDYAGLLNKHIRPHLGRMKVADLRHSDIERMHQAIAETAPYQANRAVSVVSKMCSLAIKWDLRTDNPARGIERMPESRRERFLTIEEINRLDAALATHAEKTSAAAVRLLLLTGARRGEMLSATWAQFDLTTAVWVKPSSATKQKKEHRVPLAMAVVVLLAELRAANPPGCPFVFPGVHVQDGKGPGTWSPLTEVRKVWIKCCAAAGLAEQVPHVGRDGKPVTAPDGAPVMVWRSTVRLHDLRHSYASVLASSGLSLPIIGALLGHTQAATTHRYAHLLDAPLRAATERMGAAVSAGGGKGA